MNTVYASRFRLAVCTLALALLAPACGGGRPKPAEVVDNGARTQKLCEAPGKGVYAVRPLGNKSGAKLELAGTEDLLMNEMHHTGCFTLLERDKLAVLIEEMKLCDDTNPDKAFFDCPSFAEKGKLLGASHMVVGDVILVEPNVSGSELKLKLPGVGELAAGETYGAVALQLRVLDVETGKVGKTTVTHAVLPSSQAGLGVEQGPIEMKAMFSASTPMADALQTMLASAVAEIR